MRSRREDTPTHSGSRCSTCGENMPNEFWYGLSQPPSPVHCDGSRAAWLKPGIYTPHHGRVAHPNCWHCNQPMGCDQCVSPANAICKRCACWIYPEHLARLGPMLNTPQMLSRRGGLRAPQIADYPRDFQRAYHAAHADCQPGCWCQSIGKADMSAVREFLATPGRDLPLPTVAETAQRSLLRQQAESLGAV